MSPVMLSELLEKHPGYRKHYNATREFVPLPPPEEIPVYTFEEIGLVVRCPPESPDCGERVLGFATDSYIAFREIPPPLDVFIHELIHMGLFRSGESDKSAHETIAWNFSGMVRLRAEGRPIRSLRLDKIPRLRLEDLRRIKVHGMDPEELLRFCGVGLEGLKGVLKVQRGETYYIIMLLTNIADGIEICFAEGDPFCSLYTELWNKIAEEVERL